MLQILILGAAGTAAGLGMNALSPRPARLGKAVHPVAVLGMGMCHGPAEDHGRVVQRIDVNSAKGLCTACTAAFVDARTASAFEAGHVTNAIHLPPIGHPDEGAVIEGLRAYPMVIVYDGEQECQLAERVARRLVNHALKDVRVLEGSWPAWLAAGGPGVSGACHTCVEHEKESSP